MDPLNQVLVFDCEVLVYVAFVLDSLFLIYIYSQSEGQKLCESQSVDESKCAFVLFQSIAKETGNSFVREGGNLLA